MRRTTLRAGQQSNAIEGPILQSPSRPICSILNTRLSVEARASEQAILTPQCLTAVRRTLELQEGAGVLNALRQTLTEQPCGVP
jgi:hypothetical protein